MKKITILAIALITFFTQIMTLEASLQNELAQLTNKLTNLESKLRETLPPIPSREGLAIQYEYVPGFPLPLPIREPKLPARTQTKARPLSQRPTFRRTTSRKIEVEEEAAEKAAQELKEKLAKRRSLIISREK